MLYILYIYYIYYIYIYMYVYRGISIDFLLFVNQSLNYCMLNNI